MERSELHLFIILIVGIPVLWIAWFGLLWKASTGTIKRSKPFVLAMARVAADERVVAAIGRPIELRVPTVADIAFLRGYARLELQIGGPKGDAMLTVRAARHRGVWGLQTLKALVGPGVEYDLLAESQDRAAI